MNDSLQDLATLYVLDQLEPSERAVFEARLLREPALAALVRDLEAGLARGVRSLPPREPPAGTLDRIEDRIDALRTPPAALPGIAPAPVRWVAFARWGLAAVIAVSLVTIAVQGLRPAAAHPVIVVVGLGANRSSMTELPLREPGKDADARFIQLASLAENYWAKPGSLPGKSPAATGDNSGYALFDPGSRQGFIVIEQLPAVAENERYHLWIVDPATARVSDAGILPLAGLNRGLYSFALGSEDSPPTGRPNFFITVEENGASSSPARPSGKVVLGRSSI